MIQSKTPEGKKVVSIQPKTANASIDVRANADRLIGGLEEFLGELEEAGSYQDLPKESQTKLYTLQYLLEGSADDINSCGEEVVQKVRNLVGKIKISAKR